MEASDSAKGWFIGHNEVPRRHTFRRPADIYVPSLSGSPTALDFAISAAGDLGLGRPTSRGRLLSRMPGTSQTINRLRWPVELRGSLLSRWWLKLQAPGTQALQPSSSMWRGLWGPVLVRARPASLPLAPRALCGCSLPSGQSGLEEAAGGLGGSVRWRLTLHLGAPSVEGAAS